MRLTREDGQLRLAAASYTLTTAPDRPCVYLDDAAGRRVAELWVPASIHPLNGRDDTTGQGDWIVLEADGQVGLSLTCASTAWRRKVARFTCGPRRFSFAVEVEGEGCLTEASYFGGAYSGQVRWGANTFASGQHFRQGFNPEPTTAEAYHFAPEAGSAIDLTGVPLPGRDGWFFTPPPFCFAFETEAGWLSLGVEATPGAHTFTEYRYHGQRGAFHLTLAYDGHTRVAGTYTLPAIGFDFEHPDPYAALDAHVAAARARLRLPVPAHPRPAWWREPIFCGWGAQCHLAARQHGRAPDYARQALYQGFLAALEANGVSPGTVVIDDKWQATYGDNAVDPAKWPDLPGFIRGQHAAGRRVLLWLKAWDPEGVPAEECITNAAGQAVAVDPTHPGFAARLAASVRQMLSPEGYAADGLKIDFTARIPAGPGHSTHEPAWGLELMRRYLRQIYTAAKSARLDALVIAHTPHPYLADCLDMVRLNDINTAHPVPPAMRHRARVAASACPGALIDTDNWPMASREAWRGYTPVQPQLGVPALYYATHLDVTGEPLEHEDYQLIRDTWAAYRARQGTEQAEGP
jgi:hypothetical protein